MLFREEERTQEQTVELAEIAFKLRTPKLILTDLDHTLLRSDGTISEHTLDVLKKCREDGAKLAIATARYWIGAEKYINMLAPDYEITTDGTLIHKNDTCVYSSAFSADETNRIVRKIFSIFPKAERLHKAVYCDYSEDLTCSANKIAAYLEDEMTAVKIASETGSKLQCYRGENMYAFLPMNGGKKQAIEALAADNGISPYEMVAFGDDKNDIDMLKMCGFGVAVENAIPEAKAVANHITDSNDNDGVAEWLEKSV